MLEYGLRFGTDEAVIVNNHILLALICIIIAALMIPIQLLELGEEIGWRGYLLRFQVEKYGEQKAVLLNGIEWGVPSSIDLFWFQL
ncbi:MAG: hypothetical protein K2M82_00410 [Lachnospiraceae bacterium]|nr:hypothetical protein [Lachnospiraceae bacterium]